MQGLKAAQPGKPRVTGGHLTQQFTTMKSHGRIVRLLVGMVLMGLLCHAAPPPDPAIELQASGITLTDGSSSFTFAKDGTFVSAPLGMSGRTLKGHWKLEEHAAGLPAKVVVEAKAGWVNGMSLDHDHRRMVFFIYSGKTVRYERPKGGDGKPLVLGSFPESYYQCYWIIDEFTKIAKPSLPVR